MAPMSPSSKKPKRAIGIVRVSQTKGREGETFHSPKTQRERIEEECQRQGFELLTIGEELDVKGGADLAKRPHLLAAVEAVERGEAEVVITAYLDRLVRSVAIQNEVVTRVEKAKGQVFTFDHGQITHGTAAQWLSSTLTGAMNEYFNRIIAEKSAEAQRRAVARGVVPYPNLGAGYLLRDDGKLEPHPTEAPLVAQGFEMRADGATVAAVRAFWKANGIVKSYHGTTTILRSRLVLGEIHFGDLQNLEAHEPIVSRELWERVQAVSLPRGRKPKSDRLLARLGVLVCGTCGGRMVVGMQKQHGRNYAFYRCGHVREDCDRRVTISAEIAERVITEKVHAVLSDAEGRASADQGIRDAEAAVERTQAELDQAIRTLAGFEDESAARERLASLRQARDDAQARLDEFGGVGAAVSINGASDWERLTLDERRALIRAVVSKAVVGTDGKGAERISVEVFG